MNKSTGFVHVTCLPFGVVIADALFRAQLTSLNETLENRNISLTETLEEQLNAARSLERVNERLMEEADSYQLLLQDSTMSGDFLESAFMAKTRERGMSLSFVRGPIALPKAGGKSLADEMGGVGESEAEKHIAGMFACVLFFV